MFLLPNHFFLKLNGGLLSKYSAIDGKELRVVGGDWDGAVILSTNFLAGVVASVSDFFLAVLLMNLEYLFLTSF